MHRFLDTFKNRGSNHESEKSDHDSTPSSATPSPQSKRSNDEKGFEFHLADTPPEIPDPVDGSHLDASELAALVAQYGHAPATAWLERARYCNWRLSSPIPQSSSLPVQGYLQTKGWVFALGSPLVSDKAALEPTLSQFIAWVQSHDLRLVHCCVPEDVAELLADREWCTVVGALILTPAGNSYVIKNAVQFPDAPTGTSEKLIHSVLRDLHEHYSQATPGDNSGDPKVSFNISAASDLRPTRNISGIKFTWLNQTYTKVARSAHLLNRHDFRRKFDTISRHMFVCYPTEDGIGLDGIEKLLMLPLHENTNFRLDMSVI